MFLPSRNVLVTTTPFAALVRKTIAWPSTAASVAGSVTETGRRTWPCSSRTTSQVTESSQSSASRAAIAPLRRRARRPPRPPSAGRVRASAVERGRPGGVLLDQLERRFDGPAVLELGVEAGRQERLDARPPSASTGPRADSRPAM